MKKTPKFKIGDIVDWTTLFGEYQGKFIVLERYDRRPNERIAWWIKKYPPKKDSKKFGVAEDELKKTTI
jgi:hypothetical protein